MQKRACVLGRVRRQGCGVYAKLSKLLLLGAKVIVGLLKKGSQMMYQAERGEMVSGWEFTFFKPDEFRCSCCGKLKIDSRIVRVLEQTRAEIDSPIEVTSGYRCEGHNARVGGRPHSKHKLGLAADSHAYGKVGLGVLEKIYRKHGATFTYADPKKGFVHADVR